MLEFPQVLKHRILGFGATSTKRHRKPGGGQTGQGNQETHQHPKKKSAENHSSAVVPDSHPHFLSLVRGIRNGYLHLCREPVAQFLTLKRQPIAKFLTAVLLLLLLLSYASCCCLRSGAWLRSCCFARSHRLIFF